MKDKILLTLAVLACIGSITCFAIIAKVNLDLRDQLKTEQIKDVGEVTTIHHNKITGEVTIHIRFPKGTVIGKCDRVFIERVVKEWDGQEDFGTSYDLSEMESVQPELEDWSKSFE